MWDLSFPDQGTNLHSLQWKGAGSSPLDSREVTTLNFRLRSIGEKKDTVRDTRDVWSDFLAVQWLRLHASTQGAHVGSLVREVPHASPCTQIKKERR